MDVPLCTSNGSKARKGKISATCSGLVGRGVALPSKKPSTGKRKIESSEELVRTFDKGLVEPEHRFSSLFASLRRPYNSTKRVKRGPKPRKVQELKPISSIIDGSVFKPLKFNGGKPTCCLAHRCNDKYNEEVAQALRDAVPTTGKDGCRKQRMVYVQERTASLPGNRYQLFLDDIVKVEVCIPYFCAVTGISTGLIYAARRASDLGG